MLSEQATNNETHINVPLNKRIFEMIELKPGLKRKDLAVALDVTEKTISRYVSELLSAGKIERRGSKKTGGYWILRKDVTTNGR
jgi:ATP-dependent DNA helicase RecG